MCILELPLPPYVGTVIHFADSVAILDYSCVWHKDLNCRVLPKILGFYWPNSTKWLDVVAKLGANSENYRSEISYTPSPFFKRGEGSIKNKSHLQVYCCSASVVSQNGLVCLSNPNDWRDLVANMRRGVMKCYSIGNPILCKNCPIFEGEPFFRATGWPDGHKNWYTASYGYYLGNNLGDFWFFDFLAFFGHF